MRRAIMVSNGPGSPDSDDVVTVGLRLLWELDALFAVGAHTRLDAMSVRDRENLHAALKAGLGAITATHPSRKRSERG